MLTNVSLCAPKGTRGNNYGSQQEVDVTKVGEKWITHEVDQGHSGVGAGVDPWPEDGVTTKELNGHTSNLAEPLAHNSAGGFGMVLGLFIPIILIMTLMIWIFYAYRNPHTKSGQLLIQVSVIRRSLCIIM